MKTLIVTTLVMISLLIGGFVVSSSACSTHVSCTASGNPSEANGGYGPYG